MRIRVGPVATGNAAFRDTFLLVSEHLWLLHFLRCNMGTSSTTAARRCHLARSGEPLSDLSDSALAYGTGTCVRRNIFDGSVETIGDEIATQPT